MAWKYLIYVLMMKEISKKRLHLKKGAATDIYKYVRDHHSNQQTSKLSALVSYLKRLEGIKIGKYEASMKARELERLYKLEEIQYLLSALREVASTRRIIGLVDELDRGWDSSEDARAFVAGLFQACISANSLHDNLRVYMSLRQELYDDVPALYDDAQKYRDMIETIRWNDSALLNLMARRIRHSMPGLAGADDQACWNALFPGLPGSHGKSSYSYMIDRTLYRPREIIQFCTQAIESSTESHPAIPLRYAAVREAEHIYSAERTRDIAAEHRFQYPGLMEVMVAFRGRSQDFARYDLEFLCLELITGEIPSPGTASWLEGCTPAALIEILWNVGFLRAQASRDGHGRRDGAYLGAHQSSQSMVAARGASRCTPCSGSTSISGRPSPISGANRVVASLPALDDVRIMHPISEIVRPVLGHPSWLVQRGYGSFVTMEFGEPQVNIFEPTLMPLDIDGAPARALKRSSFVSGAWHLWVYCCAWSLLLEGTQLAHDESDGVTMNRALGVLNGQILQAVDIEPADGRTRFTFDLGCSLLTYPYPPDSSDDEPDTQWYLISRSGPGLSVRGDGTYEASDRHARLADKDWLPIGTPVQVRE